MGKLWMGSSPHIHSERTLPAIMRDVLIALLPCLIAGIWVFGARALTVVSVSIISCILFEWLWNMVFHKENSLTDFSACVTGALLALALPVSVPLWLPVVGAFFAIIICKQLFGGLGNNFVNPALAARAFLFASWPVSMSAFTAPFANLPLFGNVKGIDAVAGATPLEMMKLNGEATPIINLFIGDVGGVIGETSVIAIILGAAYLVIRRVISLEGPFALILSAGIFGWLLGYEGALSGDFVFQILSGGLLFVAFFMFTDYTTTPTTAKGMITAGIIAGFITALIRTKGGYPEGITYAVLFINILTPLIDKYMRPKIYGRGRACKNG